MAGLSGSLGHQTHSHLIGLNSVYIHCSLKVSIIYS